MKVCYLPRDIDAIGYYRCLWPARELQALGHEAGMPAPKDTILHDDGFLQLNWDTKRLPRADVYVLQCRMERFWAEAGVRKLHGEGVVTVAECDDNFLELPHWNPGFRGSHPYKDLNMNYKERRAYLKKVGRKNLQRQGISQKFESAHNRNWMHETFRQCDAMTVSTPYLKELYRNYNPNIRVIRNYLDWEMWKGVQPRYKVKRKRVRVGYMGAFAYRRGDLEVVKPVVAPFLAAHPEVDFVATTDEVHDFLGVPQGRRVTTGPVDFRDMELPSITAVMDIGLVPLQMIGLNEAKSHLKGMEYNACGIPFVASPTESYKDYWCEPGKNGFLASSTAEWHEHLEALLDTELRHEMGRFSREKASRHTIQTHAHEYADFYTELLGDDDTKLAREALRRGAIQKVPELTELLKRIGEPRVVVEIGSAQGGTFYALCQKAADDALLVSIDLPGGDFQGSEHEAVEKTGKDKYGHRDMDKMASYRKPGQHVEFLRADSQHPSTKIALQKILGGRQIDFLFIDGDHSYEGVKRDFELYRDLVAEDGLVAFHDIVVHPNELRAQVHRLWRELEKSYDARPIVSDRENFDYGQWGGIGVVYGVNQKVAA